MHKAMFTQGYNVPSDPLEDVVPFKKLPSLYPQFFAAKHSADWLLRQRDSNGLAASIRWVGRTAFIGRCAFAAWIDGRKSPQRAQSPRSIAEASVGERAPKARLRAREV